MKRMKVAFAIFLVAISISSVYSQDTQVLELNLETALRIAHDNNPTIKIAETEIQRVDYARKEAIGALLPTVNAGAQYTDNVMKPVMFMPESFSAMMGGTKFMEVGYKNSFVGNVSAQLPLVNATIWQNLKNKQNDMDLIIEKCRASKIEMTKQTKDAYFQVLLAKSSFDVLQKSYDNALETLKNVENSFKQGVVSEYDYIRAQVNVNNLKPTIISAKNGIDIAIMQLRMILSLPAEQEFTFTEDLETFQDNVGFLTKIKMDSVLQNNSDLRQLDYNIKGIENQIKLINTQHYPMLTAIGSYMRQTQAEDFKFSQYTWVGSASVGLQLSIPLFAGMTKVNQAKQARMSLKGLEIQREYAKDGLKLQVRSAINSMIAAKEQLSVSKESIAQAERGYEIAKVRYEVGSGTILELNDSELSLTQSKLNHQEAIYNFLTAQTTLERIMGREQ